MFIPLFKFFHSHLSSWCHKVCACTWVISLLIFEQQRWWEEGLIHGVLLFLRQGDFVESDDQAVLIEAKRWAKEEVPAYRNASTAAKEAHFARAQIQLWIRPRSWLQQWYKWFDRSYACCWTFLLKDFLLFIFIFLIDVCATLWAMWIYHPLGLFPSAAAFYYLVNQCSKTGFETPKRI